MARIILLLSLCQIITLPILGGSTEGSPFEEMVSSFIQQYGDNAGSNVPGLVSHLVGSLMQGDNAKNLGSLFEQAGGGNNAGDILSGKNRTILSAPGKKQGNFCTACMTYHGTMGVLGG